MPSSYTLGAHYEEFVRGLVATGRYASASEVMRDALRLLEDHEQFRAARLDELRRLVAEGLASGDAGALDVDQLIAEVRKRKAGRDAA
jgi:antitoxin ParD1/3/4